MLTSFSKFSDLNPFASSSGEEISGALREVAYRVPSSMVTLLSMTKVGIPLALAAGFATESAVKLATAYYDEQAITSDLMMDIMATSAMDTSRLALSLFVGGGLRSVISGNILRNVVSNEVIGLANNGLDILFTGQTDLRKEDILIWAVSGLVGGSFAFKHPMAQGYFEYTREVFEGGAQVFARAGKISLADFIRTAGSSASELGTSGWHMAFAKTKLQIPSEFRAKIQKHISLGLENAGNILDHLIPKKIAQAATALSVAPFVDLTGTGHVQQPHLWPYIVGTGVLAAGVTGLLAGLVVADSAHSHDIHGRLAEALKTELRTNPKYRAGLPDGQVIEYTEDRRTTFNRRVFENLLAEFDFAHFFRTHNVQGDIHLTFNYSAEGMRSIAFNDHKIPSNPTSSITFRVTPKAGSSSVAIVGCGLSRQTNILAKLARNTSIDWEATAVHDYDGTNRIVLEDIAIAGAEEQALTACGMRRSAVATGWERDPGISTDPIFTQKEFFGTLVPGNIWPKQVLDLPLWQGLKARKQGERFIDFNWVANLKFATQARYLHFEQSDAAVSPDNAALCFRVDAEEAPVLYATGTKMGDRSKNSRFQASVAIAENNQLAWTKGRKKFPRETAQFERTFLEHLTIEEHFGLARTNTGNHAGGGFETGTIGLDRFSSLPQFLAERLKAYSIFMSWKNGSRHHHVLRGITVGEETRALAIREPKEGGWTEEDNQYWQVWQTIDKEGDDSFQLNYPAATGVNRTPLFEALKLGHPVTNNLIKEEYNYPDGLAELAKDYFGGDLAAAYAHAMGITVRFASLAWSHDSAPSYLPDMTKGARREGVVSVFREMFSSVQNRADAETVFETFDFPDFFVRNKLKGHLTVNATIKGENIENFNLRAGRAGEFDPQAAQVEFQNLGTDDVPEWRVTAITGNVHEVVAAKLAKNPHLWKPLVQPPDEARKIYEAHKLTWGLISRAGMREEIFTAWGAQRSGTGWTEVPKADFLDHKLPEKKWVEAGTAIAVNGFLAAFEPVRARIAFRTANDDVVNFFSLEADNPNVMPPFNSFGIAYDGKTTTLCSLTKTTSRDDNLRHLVYPLVRCAGLDLAETARRYPQVYAIAGSLFTEDAVAGVVGLRFDRGRMVGDVASADFDARLKNADLAGKVFPNIAFLETLPPNVPFDFTMTMLHRSPIQGFKVVPYGKAQTSVEYAKVHVRMLRDAKGQFTLRPLGAAQDKGRTEVYMALWPKTRRFQALLAQARYKGREGLEAFAKDHRLAVRQAWNLGASIIEKFAYQGWPMDIALDAVWSHVGTESLAKSLKKEDNKIKCNGQIAAGMNGGSIVRVGWMDTDEGLGLRVANGQTELDSWVMVRRVGIGADSSYLRQVAYGSQGEEVAQILENAGIVRSPKALVAATSHLTLGELSNPWVQSYFDRALQRYESLALSYPKFVVVTANGMTQLPDGQWILKQGMDMSRPAQDFSHFDEVRIQRVFRAALPTSADSACLLLKKESAGASWGIAAQVSANDQLIASTLSEMGLVTPFRKR